MLNSISMSRLTASRSTSEVTMTPPSCRRCWRWTMRPSRNARQRVVVRRNVRWRVRHRPGLVGLVLGLTHLTPRGAPDRCNSSSRRIPYSEAGPPRGRLAAYRCGQATLFSSPDFRRRHFAGQDVVFDLVFAAGSQSFILGYI